MSEQQLQEGEDSGLNEDEVLQYTQGLRKRFVDQITEDGGKLPTDPKEQYVFLTALGDMDRTALSNKKIGAKERNNAADRVAAVAIAKVLGRFDGGSPFIRDIIDGQPAHRTAPSLDGLSLPPITTVLGETEIGIASRDFDTFMGDMEGGKK